MQQYVVEIFLFVIIYLVALIIYLIWDYSKQLKRKEDALKKYKDQVGKLERSLLDSSEQKRLKIQLPNKDCLFTIHRIGDRSFELLKNRKCYGMIKNIRFDGMTIASPIDLPVKTEVEIELCFR